MSGRWLASIGLALAVSAMAFSQNRVNQILNATYDRVNRQVDVWFEDGDYPKCIQTLRIMNALWPEDYEVATNLGWLLTSCERDDEALSVYVRYRVQNPKEADSPFPEANYYFLKRLYAKVPPLLEPSLKLNPHANSYRILAHSFERMGMLRDSLRIWEKYLQRFPKDEAGKNNRKRVQDKLNAAKP